MIDPFLQWRRRLDGEWLPAYANIPEAGTYRLKKGDTWLPVHIWEHIDQETGEVLHRAAMGGQPCTLDRVWPRCADSPVRAGAYRYFQAHGRWPDDIDAAQTIGNSINDSEELGAAIRSLEAEAIAWFESIGSEIKTQDQADRAANFAEALLRMECRAIEGYKADAKEPQGLLAAARTKWKPLEAKAAEAKVTIKNAWILPFLRAKAADARRKRNSEAKNPARILAGAGQSKRQAIVIDRVAHLTDVPAFVAYLLGFEETPQGLLNTLQTLANRLVHSRVDPIPGVEVIEKERVC